MNTANLLNLDPVESERIAYAQGLPVAALLGRIIERDEKLDLAWQLCQAYETYGLDCDEFTDALHALKGAFDNE
tara:strand:+ start:463 stop:684 length:222 start_codon:yes stop_codon:yes gene_type:complete